MKSAACKDPLFCDSLTCVHTEVILNNLCGRGNPLSALPGCPNRLDCFDMIALAAFALPKAPKFCQVTLLSSEKPPVSDKSVLLVFCTSQSKAGGMKEEKALAGSLIADNSTRPITEMAFG